MEGILYKNSRFSVSFFCKRDLENACSIVLSSPLQDGYVVIQFHHAVLNWSKFRWRRCILKFTIFDQYIVFLEGEILEMLRCCLVKNLHSMVKLWSNADLTWVGQNSDDLTPEEFVLYQNLG